MKILIGTKNEKKIEGAKQAFESFFGNIEIQGIVAYTILQKYYIDYTV